MVENTTQSTREKLLGVGKGCIIIVLLAITASNAENVTEHGITSVSYTHLTLPTILRV